MKIAYASKKSVLGFNPVVSSTYKNKAFLIFLAKDAGKSTQEKINKITQLKNIPLNLQYTKEELGSIIKGRGEIAVVAITDPNLAKIKGDKWAKLK